MPIKNLIIEYGSRDKSYYISISKELSKLRHRSEILEFLDKNQYINLIIVNQLIKKLSSVDIGLCIELFNSLTKYDTAIYNSFISAAGKNGQFTEARKAFMDARGVNLVDIITYNSFIDAAGKNNQFDDAKEAFQEAKAKDLDDTFTYNSFIDAAGKNGRFDDARKAMMEARKKNLTNTITYATFIDIAGKHDRFDDARRAMMEAREKNLTNIVTYSTFIDIAGKNGRFDDAKKAFDEAQKKQLANEITYNNFIDAAMKNEHKADALALAEVYKFPCVDKCIEKGEIDFHYENASSIELILDYLIKKEAQTPLKIITGKGLHSKDNFSPVKEKFISYSKSQGIEFIQDKTNSGVYIINTLPKNIVLPFYSQHKKESVSANYESQCMQ
ncbi:hypothetical protein [Piscirickettsia salmonis]|uniref:hypothetical protein n=1 Tax=Piscirickettsia salmonis TaxID=1238 RepID=UPI0007C95207|nr:PPR repeat protein [Piscirickettsiaceae bacterium NZ-RLO1]